MASSKNIFSTFKSDFPASIVVFLVAVPLCLGIASACGLPAFSGIIAGVIGGIVVGIFSGSQLGVSGPAAGLISIVIGALGDFKESGIEDYLGTFFLAVALSGIIQFLFGVLKGGVIAYYFPTSVIKGLLSAIGIIIILKEVPHALGDDKVFEGLFDFNQNDGHNTFTEWYYMFEDIHISSLIIGVVSILILIFWDTTFMKNRSFTKIIQGPLVVVLLGIVAYNIFLDHATLALGKEHMVNLAIPAESAGFIEGLTSRFHYPNFSQILNMDVWLVAFVIALVASIETLLCLEATDKMDTMKRVSPANKELKAQGIGNLLSGLIGGLPITQVIVRSSTNIQSGGKTKMSAIYHGVIMLLCVMLFPFVLNMIPRASLAAILIIVGFKLAKPSLFKSMIKLGKDQFIPFIVTVVVILFTNILIGIGIGLLVAIVFLLYNNYKKPFLFKSEKHFKDDAVHLELAEDVTFINKASIQRTLSELPDNCKVVIDASRSINIDHDVMEIFEEFRANAKFRNIELQFIELNSIKMKNQAKEFSRALGEK